MSRKDKVPRQSGNAFKIAQQAARAVENSGKSVRKNPATAIDVVSRGDSSNRLPVRFVFGNSDNDGPWSLSSLKPEHVARFFEILSDKEKKTVGELFGANNPECTHYPNFAECPNGAAVDRIEELGYEASPHNLFRFEVTAKQRLYGLVHDNEFHVLWWDPEHEIWPSKKKNT